MIVGEHVTDAGSGACERVERLEEIRGWSVWRLATPAISSWRRGHETRLGEGRGRYCDREYDKRYILKNPRARYI